MEDTTAGGWGTAMDASLVNGLTSDAGMGIDVVMALQEGEEIVINIRGNKLWFEFWWGSGKPISKIIKSNILHMLFAISQLN